MFHWSILCTANAWVCLNSSQRQVCARPRPGKSGSLQLDSISQKAEGFHLSYPECQTLLRTHTPSLLLHDFSSNSPALLCNPPQELLLDLAFPSFCRNYFSPLFSGTRTTPASAAHTRSDLSSLLLL